MNKVAALSLYKATLGVEKIKCAWVELKGIGGYQQVGINSRVYLRLEDSTTKY